MGGDGDIATEGQRLTAVKHHRRLELAGDRGLRDRNLLGLALRIIQIQRTPLQVLLYVRAPRPKHRCIRIVDHDLCSSAGEFPQRVRPADMVDMAVG